MLNIAKRDERRADKTLFKKLLNEHDMIQDMRDEITKLQKELNEQKFNQEEAEENKRILADIYDKEIIDNFGNLK